MITASEPISVPIIIRGRVIEGDEWHFSSAGGTRFLAAPRLVAHVDELPLSSPSEMFDLHSLRLREVASYLDRLGRALEFGTNRHLQRAYELSRRTSGLSDSVLRHCYETLRLPFRHEVVCHLADRLIGAGYIDGWVRQETGTTEADPVYVRALGARTVHVVAGNVPSISAATILNNAITRGDAIIKTPSNDPLTAAALALTMIDLAPDHPLTRHVAVAYWKGGDSSIEQRLYSPNSIDKIVAWGGAASVQHVLARRQLGIDVITLDPKRSAAIIDARCLDDESALDDVCHRLAVDIGILDQECCFSVRVVYVLHGLEPRRLERINRLGERTAIALDGLPYRWSTGPVTLDEDLKAELDALQWADGEFRVFHAPSGRGAIIVSQSASPVDFADNLRGRVANLVPVPDISFALKRLNNSTQTLSVYPDDLKSSIRDGCGAHGVQRLVPLGRALMRPEVAAPHDGAELLRRMCRWVVDETGVEPSIPRSEMITRPVAISG